MDIKTQFYQIQLKTIDLSPHVFFFSINLAQNHVKLKFIFAFYE